MMQGRTLTTTETFLVALPLVPLQWSCWGWSVSTIWRWYVVPFGAPALSVPVAIGLLALLACLSTKRIPSVVTWDNVVDPFVRPLFLLLVAWVARLFL